MKLVDLLPPDLFIYPPAAVVIVLPGKSPCLIDIRTVQFGNMRLLIGDSRSPSHISYIRLHSEQRLYKLQLPFAERFMLPGVNVHFVSCFGVPVSGPGAQSNNVPAFASG